MEELVLDYLNVNCPISKIRDRSKGKNRMVKTLIVKPFILDSGFKRIVFEVGNKNNHVMLGLIYSCIEKVFVLTHKERVIIASKYLGL